MERLNVALAMEQENREDSMALTPEQIYGLRVRSGMDAFRPMKEHWQAKDDDAAYRFARTIETEVRKQDDALILQMHDALETCDSADGYNGPYQFHDDKAVEAAINAARARLGEKT